MCVRKLTFHTLRSATFFLEYSRKFENWRFSGFSASPDFLGFRQNECELSRPNFFGKYFDVSGVGNIIWPISGRSAEFSALFWPKNLEKKCEKSIFFRFFKNTFKSYVYIKIRSKNTFWRPKSRFPAIYHHSGQYRPLH